MIGESETVTGRETSRTVIDSIHSADGRYCVDVVRSPDGYTLQTCRRDEGGWQVIDRPGGGYHAREEAVAGARALIATLE